MAKFKEAFVSYKRAREAELKDHTLIVPAAFSREKTQISVPASFLKREQGAGSREQVSGTQNAVPATQKSVPAETIALPTLEAALAAVPAEIREFLQKQFATDFTVVSPATQLFCARVDENEESSESLDDDDSAADDLPEVD